MKLRNHSCSWIALLCLGFAGRLAGAQVTFANPALTQTQKAPIWVVTADFNGDGKSDLAVADGGSQEVAISLGNGDGTFQTPVTYSTGTGCAPNYLATGDFNSDGKIDLLVACVVGNELLVLPGNGNGTFGTAIVTTFPVVTIAGEDLLTIPPAVADFNMDGKLDIVLLAGTAEDSGTKNGKLTNPVDYLLLGNGNGTFQAPQAIAAFAGKPALSFASADFNGDGKPDLAAIEVTKTSGETSLTLLIALGQGDGTFQIAQTYPLSAGFDLTVADVNADGIPDILVSGFTFQDETKLKDAESGFAVYVGKGDGTFSLTGTYPLESGSYLAQIAAVDLRGVGHPDIVGTQWLSIEGVNQASSISGVSGAVVWLAGNGDGTFQPASDLAPASSEIPIDIVSADFNGDGRPDLAFTSVPVTGLASAIPNPDTGNLQESADEIVALFPAGTASVLLNTTPPATFSDANAAGFQRGSMAQDSIVAAFGSGLASTTAQPPALTTNLGGVTVTVVDSAGSSRLADLFYVSPAQVNYAMPAGTAAGTAQITIANGPSSVTVSQNIVPVVPGLFAVNGIAAAQVETFQGSTMTASSLAFQVSASGAITPQPINVTAGQVYLLMYGTGIRHASSVTLNVGSQTGLPVAYYGTQGYFVGEDQINVLLPASLAGAGLVNLTLSADGQTSNPVQIQIQ